MSDQDSPTKVNELLADASPEQRKWVVQRVLCTSDAEAARRVGVHPATVSRWPNKESLDAAVVTMLSDPLEHAVRALLEAIPKAVSVKIGGLDSRRDAVAQASATEILDRIMGKPTQRVDQHTEHAGSVVVVSWDDATTPSED
jgi:predicted urease superfamily metal-dependent hydrolase